MLGALPGVQSIRLGGPVSVMSRSSGPGCGGPFGTARARVFAESASSRAVAGPRALALRASCRGVNAGLALASAGGLALASAALSLPGGLLNNENAIGRRGGFPPWERVVDYVPFSRGQQAGNDAKSDERRGAAARLDCPGRACYNRRDTSARKDVRRGGLEC